MNHSHQNNPSALSADDYRNALEAMNGAVLITDADPGKNHIEYANEAFSELSGYGRQEVLGQNCRLLQGEFTDRHALDAIRSALQRATVHRTLLRNRRKSGEDFWNELTISPVYGNEGEVTHFIGFQNDVTKRVEQEQHMLGALLAADIFDVLRESTLVLSADLHIERANAAFLNLFHKTQGEVQDQLLWNLGEAWGASGLRYLLEDKLRIAPEGTLTNIEIQHDFQNGVGKRVLCLNARRLVGDPGTGRPERIFLAIEDITAQRREQQENEQLKREAITALKTRDRMLQDVLSAATDGKLLLCLDATELPERGDSTNTPVQLTLPSLRDFRMIVRQHAQDIGIASERVDDFENAVGEAAMNAVVHGGGGIGRVCKVGNAKVQVWMSDSGGGISVADLPRAALEKGFSSVGTMGQGFKIILKTADRIFLMTNDTGTTVVLEQEKDPPLPSWLLDLNSGGF